MRERQKEGRERGEGRERESKRDRSRHSSHLPQTVMVLGFSASLNLTVNQIKEKNSHFVFFYFSHSAEIKSHS